jgi:hypothetical protein
MKVFFTALSLGALVLSASSAFAADVGSIDFVAYMDGGAPTFDTQFDVSDTGSALVGTGSSIINLTKEASGYQGFAFGRALNISCSATHCTDNGSTELDIAVAQVAGGYTLSGTLNFVYVQATVTSSEISVNASGIDTGVAFDLSSTNGTTFSGQGNSGTDHTFNANLNTSGTLAGLTDPATFIALMVNPFIKK